jgi:ELWxxDGT repeat protein
MDTNLGEVVLVQDINPGFTENTESFEPAPLDPDRPFSPPPDQFPNNSFPRSLVEFNDKLYFSANNGENGTELYVSDGTGSGTKLVKDINPGADKYGYSYGSYPYDFVEFNGKLYFGANNEETGTELYVSDGTTVGTELLVDISPGENDFGAYSSSPSNFVELNDKLYFTANNGENGNELYVTDGTVAGTQLVSDLRTGEDNYGNINGAYPNNLVEFNGKLYFTANNGESGSELYVSDGTTGGTELLLDLRTGEDIFGNVYGSYPGNFLEFNGKLYFSANNGENGGELYVTDGTAGGTELLVDIYPGENNYGNINGSEPSNLVEFNDKLYFSASNEANGVELFVSDGTAEGTSLVADINLDKDSSGFSYGSSPSDLVVFNDKLYFTANDGENGRELYVSDGTTVGTQLVADIFPGLNNYSFPNSSSPYNLTVVGDELFFSAENGEAGVELFKLTLGSEGEDILCSCAGDDLAAL